MFFFFNEHRSCRCFLLCTPRLFLKHKLHVPIHGCFDHVKSLTLLQPVPSPFHAALTPTLFRPTCDRFRSNFAKPAMTQKTSWGSCVRFGSPTETSETRLSRGKLSSLRTETHRLRVHTLALALYISQTEEGKTQLSITRSLKLGTIEQREATTRPDTSTTLTEKHASLSDSIHKHSHRSLSCDVSWHAN